MLPKGLTLNEADDSHLRLQARRRRVGMSLARIA